MTHHRAPKPARKSASKPKLFAIASAVVAAAATAAVVVGCSSAPAGPTPQQRAQARHAGYVRQCRAEANHAVDEVIANSLAGKPDSDNPAPNTQNLPTCFFKLPLREGQRIVDQVIAQREGTL